MSLLGFQCRMRALPKTDPRTYDKFFDDDSLRFVEIVEVVADEKGLVAIYRIDPSWLRHH